MDWRRSKLLLKLPVVLQLLLRSELLLVKPEGENLTRDTVWQPLRVSGRPGDRKVNGGGVLILVWAVVLCQAVHSVNHPGDERSHEINCTTMLLISICHLHSSLLSVYYIAIKLLIIIVDIAINHLRSGSKSLLSLLFSNSFHY